MILVGELALWMGGMFALWVVIASVAGATTGETRLVSSATRGLLATAIMLLLAIAGLVVALVRRDYSLAFAAATTSHALPAPYAAAALWSARGGAALLIALGVALPGAFVAPIPVSRRKALLLILLAVVLIVLIAPIVATNTLFERLSTVVAQGTGLSPHLQSPFMLVQPPLIAAGYGLALVHASSVVTAVGARDSDVTSRALARTFGVMAWFVVGVAALVALRWANQEPLVDGAWLQRVMHDGSLWLWLALSASVATAAWGSPRSAAVNAALAVIVIAIAAMCAIVWPLAIVERFGLLLGSPGGIMASAVTIGLVLVVWVSGRRLVQDPVVPSRGSTRRLPIAVAILGVVLVLFALIGVRGRSGHDVQLRDGVAITLHDPRGAQWQLVSQGVSSYQLRNRDVRALAVELTRDGQAKGLVTSERWQAIERDGRLLGAPVTTTGVFESLSVDVRLTLGQTSEGFATARVVFEPFVLWLWIGGALLLAGGALAAILR